MSINKPCETDFGYRLAEELKSNNYLKTIYQELIEFYSERILFGSMQDIDHRISDSDIVDGLRFTDLLCKSLNHPDSYQLKQIGQQMLLTLINLAPNDSRVSLYAESIFSNLGNFKGLDTVRKMLGPSQFRSLDLNEQLEISLRREILRVPGTENEFFLPDQISIYDALQANSVSYSGPTSMGKSYIFRKFIADYISNQNVCDFAIIVPSKALINETKRKLLSENSLLLREQRYKLVTSSNDLALSAPNTRFIFVMTPERFVNLLSEDKTNHVGYIFIDEAQKIIQKEDRSAFYYKMLSHPALKNRDIKYIFASPNIPNPSVFGDLLRDNMDLKGIRSIYSPVSQFVFLINLNNQEVGVQDLLQKKFIKIRRKTKAYDLHSFIHAVANEKKNLVYSNSKRKTIEYAKEYSKRYGTFAPDDIQAERNKLSNLIRSEIHNEYYLADLVQFGIAFHASFLPERFREKIEAAFLDGIINTIFCTSTLLEGVNLPADNLFVTSSKNGRSTLSSIGFKNLIGRSGRLEYNLSGNVFLICGEKLGKESNFQDLISKPVEPQQLSIEKIPPKVKKAMLENLCNGNFEMPGVIQVSHSGTEEVEFCRRLGRILVRDLADSRNSYLVQQFREIDESQRMTRIQQVFPLDKTSESVTVSYDQENDIDQAVKNGLRYPRIGASYLEIVNFLKRLNKIFKWDTFETGLSSSKIKYVAVLLQKWIEGNGVSMIISQSIWHHAKDNYVYNQNTRQREPFDGKDVEKKNWIIQDTLETIENTILFSIANYFHIMSDAIKRELGTESIKNDWYEYVEFGTSNEKSIFLQKIGFSRDTANKILKAFEISEKDHSEEHEGYLRFVIPKEILLSNSEQIVSEAREVLMNMPEVFSN